MQSKQWNGTVIALVVVVITLINGPMAKRVHQLLIFHPELIWLRSIRMTNALH